MEPKKSKSRNLSVYDFFQVLQLEWLVADLRVRIYPKAKDKNFWLKVREGKAQKFEAIAEKNHGLPTIFTDDEMRKAFEAKVYKQWGSPDFFYKDALQKDEQEQYDLVNYYQKDADVRFEWYGETKVGKVKSYIPLAPSIVVEFEGKPVSLPVSNVTRIL